LLGEKADWELMLERIEKLKSFGKETTDWYNILQPVLKRFVKSFEEPESAATRDFWQKIAAHSDGGSGPTYLSGWIVAFCFFDSEGKSLYAPGGVRPEGKMILDGGMKGKGTRRFKLDGQWYHRLDSADIPQGFAEVDVLLDDNGVTFETVMVAGLVGINVTSVEKGDGHALQPVAGWWLFDQVSAVSDT